jgi:hypothetical protein
MRSTSRRRLVEPEPEEPAAVPAGVARVIEMWPLTRLRSYPRNARVHSPEQIAQIARSIEQWGFTIPVLVDESGMIIAGHGRVPAAKRVRDRVGDCPLIGPKPHGAGQGRCTLRHPDMRLDPFGQPQPRRGYQLPQSGGADVGKAGQFCAMLFCVAPPARKRERRLSQRTLKRNARHERYLCEVRRA